MSYLCGVIGLMLVQKILSCDTVALSLRIWGLSYHPRGEVANAHLMPWKLDAQAYLVLNLGAGLYGELPLTYPWLTFRWASAFYFDCARQRAGMFFIGMQSPTVHWGSHALQGSFGVAYLWRCSWERLSGYQNPGFFRDSRIAPLQYRWIPAGELCYLYTWHPSWAFSIGIVPGWPHLIHLSIGIQKRFTET
ncbi:MAG: hypothetical protein N2170_00640 [Bacteroidia bacterium]|nr:hypothetical protein [Bacteroidia bacterium]